MLNLIKDKIFIFEYMKKALAEILLVKNTNNGEKLTLSVVCHQPKLLLFNKTACIKIELFFFSHSEKKKGDHIISNYTSLAPLLGVITNNHVSRTSLYKMGKPYPNNPINSSSLNIVIVPNFFAFSNLLPASSPTTK